MACYPKNTDYYANNYNSTTPAVVPSVYPTTAPALPSGYPTGPSTTIVAPPGEQAPQTVQSTLYTPGYLRTQIGKKIRVEFLIGTATLIDRSGTLVGVGTSYILIQPVGTDDIMLCDIYSIKFVTFLL